MRDPGRLDLVTDGRVKAKAKNRDKGEKAGRKKALDSVTAIQPAK